MHLHAEQHKMLATLVVLKESSIQSESKNHILKRTTLNRIQCNRHRHELQQWCPHRRYQTRYPPKRVTEVLPQSVLQTSFSYFHRNVVFRKGLLQGFCDRNAVLEKLFWKLQSDDFVVSLCDKRRCSFDRNLHVLDGYDDVLQRNVASQRASCLFS